MKLLLLDRPVDLEIINNREVEFLGPWAQPINSPEDLLEPSFEPYPTSESISRACLNTIEMTRDFLDSLSNLMPVLTGVNRGKRFWDLLLMHHVIVLLGMVEDIRTRHSSLPEDDYILGLSESDYGEDNIPYSWSEGLETLFYEDRFRWYLSGLYLKSYYKNSEFLKYSRVPCKNLKTKVGRLFSRNPWNIFKRLRNIAELFLIGQDGLRGEGRLDNGNHSLLWDQYNLNGEIAGELKVTPFSRRDLIDLRSLPGISKNKEMRKRINDTLPHPYGELLSLSLPLVAIEGLQYLVESIAKNKLNKFDKIKRIYTHGQGFSDEATKRVLLALLADEGKEIVSIQHGGGDTYFVHPCISIEKNVADEYISWGPGYIDIGKMTVADRCKFLPSIYLYNLKRKNPKIRKMKWDVLFVVLEENRYVKWLYPPLYPDMAHDYFMREKVLFDYFGVKKKVAVKVYPRTFGWGQADWISNKYRMVKILTQGKFVDFALQSELIIVDYNSTAFLEMLAMRKPFLATWNRRWFRGKDVFEEFLDKMKDAGIFFEQPEMLIEAYEGIISGNIDCWWNETQKQEVLEEMAENFALTSDKVYQMWDTEFQRR